MIGGIFPKRLVAVLSSAALLVFAASLFAGSAQASASPGLRSAAFRLSSIPKTVVMTPQGKIVSVREGLPRLPDITVHDTCNPGWGCFYTNVIPEADFGFTGLGKATGTWYDRSAIETGDYTAEACWTTACSGYFGPDTYIALTGDVTGKSWDNRSG